MIRRLLRAGMQRGGVKLMRVVRSPVRLVRVDLLRRGR